MYCQLQCIANYNVLPITDTSYEKFVVIDIGWVDIVAAYKPSSAW